MRRIGLLIIVLSLLLGVGSPLFAGILAWGYVDSSSHKGPIYLWLYSLPLGVARLLGTDSPGYSSLALIYAAQYAALFCVVAGVLAPIRLYLRRGQEPVSK